MDFNYSSNFVDKLLRRIGSYLIEHPGSGLRNKCHILRGMKNILSTREYHHDVFAFTNDFSFKCKRKR